ncbi:MAG: hypothetical protein HOK28_20660 [Deltaproteobacteria bacterium]|nr:hypothetical protein [Deltaproteobacteria bacterium]
MKNLSILTFALVGFFALVGCKATGASIDGCSDDSECPAGQACDIPTATCKCTTDDACELALGAGYECNDFGSCQPRPPCLGNQDCAEGEICNSADATGGICIPAGDCGSTVHCDFNEYCNPTTGECEDGCRNVGDCQLGYVCQDNACVPGNCTTCPTSPTVDATYCDYGEVCTEAGACVPHPVQSTLCDTCGQNSLTQCGLDTICLLDDMSNSGGAYCAPVCDVDADCPNGYPGCGGVQTVGQTGCTSDLDCLSGGVCLSTSEGDLTYCSCVSNADCVTKEGLCDTTLGFGFCLTDGSPCNQDLECNFCANGTCANAPGIRCNTEADCLSSCVMQELGDGSSIGSCQTNWKVCGKEQGVTCTELQSGLAECTEL